MMQCRDAGVKFVQAVSVCNVVLEKWSNIWGGRNTGVVVSHGSTVILNCG